MERAKRWYDNCELGKMIDALEKMSKNKRDMILVEMKNIIVDYDAEIVMNHIFDFPLQDRKRWYDMDPISWVVINVLKYANKELLDKIIVFLRNTIK